MKIAQEGTYFSQVALFSFFQLWIICMHKQQALLSSGQSPQHFYFREVLIQK